MDKWTSLVCAVNSATTLPCRACPSPPHWCRDRTSWTCLQPRIRGCCRCAGSWSSCAASAARCAGSAGPTAQQIWMVDDWPLVFSKGSICVTLCSQSSAVFFVFLWPNHSANYNKPKSLRMWRGSCKRSIWILSLYAFQIRNIKYRSKP